MGHRKCHAVWRALLVLYVCLGSHAAATESLLLDQSHQRDVTRYLQVLPEGGTPLTLDEVRDRWRDNAFSPVPVQGINRGYDVEAFWYRLALTNPAGTVAEQVMEITFPPLDYIDLYVVDGGSTIRHIATGDQRPLHVAQIRHRHFAIPFKVEPGASIEIFMRVQTEGSHQVPVWLWQTRAFIEVSQTESLFFGLYFGVLLVMLIYNLCLGLLTDDRGYFPYVWVVLFFGGLQANLTGYAYQYLTSLTTHAGAWTNLSVPLLSGLSTAAVLWFAYVFLDIPRNLPGFRRPILLLLGTSLLMTVASLLLPYRLVVPIVAALSIPSTLTCVIAGIAAAMSGLRVARFYLLGWGAFVIGILLKMSELFGLLPPSPLTLYSWQLGMLATVLLLSIALADRINLERKAKLLAQSEALQAREQSISNLSRYQRLVDNVREGLFEADTDGRLLSVNPAMLRLFGQTRIGALIEQSGRTHNGLSATPGAYGDLCQRAVDGDDIRDAEIELLRADGTQFWGLLSLQPNRDDAGNVASLDGRVFDVSERKANEVLARERAVAEAATTAKSDFLAHMSHELRTPMNAVIGFTNLALQTTDERQRVGHLQRIESASTTLLHIINDILDLSKVEAGKLDLEQSSFDLRALLQRVETMMVPPASAKGLVVQFDLPPDLPHHVIGDSLRLEQVLNNLTSNAVKFTESGTVTVSVAHRPSENDNRSVSFRVCDTGIGMTRAECLDLFKPFVQADASITRRYGGTGLGLAIAQRLVTLMGGRLSVDSVLGKGSCFLFELKLKLATPPSDAARMPAVKVDAGKGPLSGMCLLLAEDNALNRELAQQILSAAGADVDVVGDGAAALTQVVRKPYDAVLMDLQMPVMDGYTATREIRALPGRASLPIIAVTANAMQGDREACLDAGMTGFLSKPINTGELTRVVASFRRSPQISTGNQPDPPAMDPSHYPGLDLEAAVQRLGGRRALLLRLLKSFARDEGDAPDRIAVLVDNEQLDAAARAAHGIKGLASSLGCSRLARAAAVLEDDCRHGIADTVDELREAHAEVMNTIARLPADDEPRETGPILAAAELADRLRDLLRLLDEGDFAANERAHPLSASLHSKFPDDADAFLEQVDRCDFAAAATIVRHWLLKLQPYAVPEDTP